MNGEDTSANVCASTQNRGKHLYLIAKRSSVLRRSIESDLADISSLMKKADE
jgi:hypothetical protein